MTATIRPARRADSETIAELLGQLGHPAEAPEVVERLSALEDFGGACVLVEEEAGRVVGVVSAFTTPVLHRPGNVGRISVLVVAADRRGTGAGKRLMAAIEAWLAGRGCSRVELTSAQHRVEAHAFYERLGYVREGIRMTRRLDPAAAGSA